MKRFCIISVLLLMLSTVVTAKTSDEVVDIVTESAVWFNIDPMTAEQLSNKIILVEYFKTWQLSTENTAMFLNHVHDALDSDNFMVLGLSNEAVEKVEQHVKKYNIKYPVVCGATPLTATEVPYVFVLKNSMIVAQDPLKVYDFTYLWNIIDKDEMEKLQATSSNFEADYKKLKQKKSVIYYNFFKQLYKMSISSLKTTVPNQLEIKQYENIYEMLEPAEREIFDECVTIDNEKRICMIREDLTEEQKKTIIGALLDIGFVGIIEDILRIVVKGMFYLVGDEKRGVYSQYYDVTTRKQKKFYKFVKNAQTDILKILEIDVDKYF